jgi:hypothetical protein
MEVESVGVYVLMGAAGVLFRPFMFILWLLFFCVVFPLLWLIFSVFSLCLTAGRCWRFFFVCAWLPCTFSPHKTCLMFM